MKGTPLTLKEAIKNAVEQINLLLPGAEDHDRQAEELIFLHVRDFLAQRFTTLTAHREPIVAAVGNHVWKQVIQEPEEKKSSIKIFTVLFSLALLVGLTSCGKTENGSITTNPPPVLHPVPVPLPLPDVTDPATGIVSGPSPTPSPTPVLISLTKYSITKTTVPNGAQPAVTFTSTGTCVSYQTRNYCWDDGIKITPSNGNSYSFWGLNNSPLFGNCFGGCISDPVNQPTYFDITVTANNVYFQSSVAQVFASAIHVTETCTETATAVTCTSFTIDLTKVPL